MTSMRASRIRSSFAHCDINVTELDTSHTYHRVFLGELLLRRLFDLTQHLMKIRLTDGGGFVNNLKVSVLSSGCIRRRRTLNSAISCAGNSHAISQPGVAYRLYVSQRQLELHIVVC